MGDITLSSAVRNNLLSLQGTADLLGKTQERLSTGLKVNSALDDPSSFFTAAALNNRASDLNRLLDSVGLSVQTIEAADQGITAITDLVEAAQASARQALQSPGPVTPAVAAEATGSVTVTADVVAAETSGAIADNAAVAALTGTLTITGTGTSGGSYTIDFDGATGTSGTPVTTTAELDAELALAAAATGLTIDYDGIDGSAVTFTAAAGESITFDTANLTGISAGTTDPNTQLAAFNDTLSVTVGSGTQQDIDLTAVTNRTNLLSTINAGLTGATATLVSNNVVITADDTADSLTIAGAGATSLGLADAAPTTGTAVNNSARVAAEAQFNTLRTQIDQLSADASFNGNNLLQGDDLSAIFNSAGTSSLTITGVTYNSAGLGINEATAGSFQTNANIQTTLSELDTAISTLRTQASTFGSNLSVVETRQQFTNNLINVLETGAGNLTLADTNEEGANLLALQTRQQLSSVSLSLASQADQAVLRLF